MKLVVWGWGNVLVGLVVWFSFFYFVLQDKKWGKHFFFFLSVVLFIYIHIYLDTEHLQNERQIPQ